MLYCNWQLQLAITIGNLDNDPENLTFYGENPEGQTPLEESDNNVEVFPAQLSNINNDELPTHTSDSIDPLQESSSFGIDIYTFIVSPNCSAEIGAI